MKLFFLLLFTLPLTIQAQDDKNKAEPLPKIDLYWFVMIKTGPRQDFDSTRRSELFRGHMSNMKRLAAEGYLKIAGPYGKNDFNWRGIFILDCETREEAEKLVATDPAVEAGLFAVDIVPWYSSSDGNLQHTRNKEKTGQ